MEIVKLMYEHPLTTFLFMFGIAIIVEQIRLARR